MNKTQWLLSGILFGFSIFLIMSFDDPKVSNFAEIEGSFSYAYGVLIGTDLKSKGFSSKLIDIKELSEGISDALAGETDMNLNTAELLTEEGFKKAKSNYLTLNLKEGKAFLSENARRKSVKSTGSGLQYEILNEGNGPKPTLEDKVSIHYHGMLVNGTIFDSSVNRGKPSSFPLNGLIKGLQEGLQLMVVGSKYKFYIPSVIAYGDNQAGKVPAGATLIFEVELLGINE